MMTPEERAVEVVEAWRSKPNAPWTDHALTQRLAAAIRDAVTAERERCAKVAEGKIMCNHCTPDDEIGFCECYGVTTLREIAARIREGT